MASGESMENEVYFRNFIMNRACGILTPTLLYLSGCLREKALGWFLGTVVGGDACRVQWDQEYYISSGTYASSTPISEILILRSAGQMGSELKRE